MSTTAPRILPPMNDGKPFRAVRVPDEDGTVRLGVVDETTHKVWIEYDLVPTLSANALATVPPPPPPPKHYATHRTTSIGGVSKTVRLHGVLRAAARCKDRAVTFLATRALTATAVRDAVAAHVAKDASVDEAEYDPADGGGYTSEVLVHDASRVARVAACVARAGATPLFEDPKDDARRPIGIERLDRVDEHGPRRGFDNWTYRWMPSHWRRVPLTWEALVDNVWHEDVGDLPRPLRHHAARAHLAAGDHAVCGARWTRTSKPTPEERAWRDFWDDEPPPVNGVGMRRLLEDEAQLPAAARATIAAEGTLPPEVVQEYGPFEPSDIVCTADGTWWIPRDPRTPLAQHVPRTPCVSAHLEVEQSTDLVDGFYALYVEGVEDPEMRHALELKAFRAMVERGYTARWLGPYTQKALHVGNGDHFRAFPRLPQYTPHRLPAATLNKLCTRHGTLRARGSKGSRSKYAKLEDRYVPKKRMRRTDEDEERMLRGDDDA